MEDIMEEYIQRFGLAEDYSEVSDSFALDITQTAPTSDECR
jgi:hypothetical protein